MTLRLTLVIAAALVAKAGFAQLFGDQQIISTQADGASSVITADMDGDGDQDVLSASFHDNKLAWYQNLGGGNIGIQQIIATDSEDVSCVFAADLDGDGDMDVLSASESMEEGVVWYENLGAGLFGTQQIISSEVMLVQSVRANDLDGDGDLDVLSASLYDDKIAWYENLGGGQFGPQQIFISMVSGAFDVHAADLDGDGDLDVLSISIYDDKLVWFENLGGGLFGSQQNINIIIGPKDVHTSDIDSDGDEDVLVTSWSFDRIYLIKNLGPGLFSGAILISSQTDGAESVYTADLDMDGHVDILSASSYDDKIAMYENLGSGNFGTQQIITTQANSANCVYSADLDGDGDMDVLSASSADDKIAWYENMTFTAGCTDPLACNYDSSANVSNGSCCYANCGCTNPIASNYLETAACDNGTCEFSITGTVYFDENENGVMDGGEYGIPFQTVVMQESGQTYITNDEGNFIASISQQQLASFEVINSLTFPYNTTTNPQIFDADTSTTTQLFFGVTNQMPMFDILIDLYPEGNGFLCNAYSHHNICFRNMGNVPIDGIIEIEYDELFQGYQEVTPIDSVIGNTVYLSYENLLPGQMFFFDIDLLTPTVDHIGEFVTSYARVYGYYEGEEVAFGEDELTMEIACAYDPNDKQAFPIGYTDDHLLLQQTEQEFLIRFQNTGNAPAQNIRIQDTLDVNFDITTFRMIANSHSVMTTVDPETRLIDFFFENIQLPDSVNNEPASHGVISYMITPNADIPVGTVLENTAYIYFDNNEPIITNTTWTTIHECGGEAAFEPVAVLICDEPQVNFESSYDLVEQYSWHVDGVEAGGNSELLLSSMNNPEYEVTLTASNPLCTDTNTITYQVPDIESIDPCLADLNCDGFRSTQDLLVMISDFGCVSDCQADLDNNAIVNVIDLVIFVSLFELSCWD